MESLHIGESWAVVGRRWAVAHCSGTAAVDLQRLDQLPRRELASPGHSFRTFSQLLASLCSANLLKDDRPRPICRTGFLEAGLEWTCIAEKALAG